MNANLIKSIVLGLSLIFISQQGFAEETKFKKVSITCKNQKKSSVDSAAGLKAELAKEKAEKVCGSNGGLKKFDLEQPKKPIVLKKLDQAELKKKIVKKTNYRIATFSCLNVKKIFKQFDKSCKTSVSEWKRYAKKTCAKVLGAKLGKVVGFNVAKPCTDKEEQPRKNEGSNSTISK
ncbi:MAG: hypothetical protein CME70_23910 [Halobacteriovorax sp.]|nr:hypothetical protein [Halobacteriovorax sp.]|tara:strand:+ start:48476 stop:49006 length:531 start_codon:yes stop_codon:yes gene_type:complete